MTYHLSDEQEKYFYDTLEELCRQSRLLESHRYIQHGDTSVFRHSVSVAYFSYYLALKTVSYTHLTLPTILRV